MQTRDFSVANTHTYIITEDMCYFTVHQNSLDMWNNKFLHKITAELFLDTTLTTFFLDLVNVHYVDSSTLGLFIHIVKDAKKLNNKVYFLHVQDEVMSILKMVSLDAFFDILEK
jgi:anti-anti-sigma factor